MEFAAIIAASFIPAIAYEIKLKLEGKSMDQYNLLLALALAIQTRAKDKNHHTVIDSLIDLEDCSFFEYDKRLYDLAKPFNDALDNELLDRIIELANQLKEEKKA